MNISVKNIHLNLAHTPVLHGISADFKAGQFTGIIGPNGAGKSSLLRAILGLIPSSGSIHIDGLDAASLSPAQRAKHIAYLPQGQILHWPINVERLVGLGRLPHLGPFSRISDADQAIIIGAMERTDVIQFRHRDASELSGGERARVFLARALAVEAPALFVDEPLANLDPGHQIDVMNCLRREKQQGNLIVAVLHDLELAARYCDKLLLLHEGKLMADGPPQQVLTAAQLEKIYGVKANINFDGEMPCIQVISRLF